MSTEQNTTVATAEAPPAAAGVSETQTALGHAIFDALTAESGDAEYSNERDQDDKPYLHCWGTECDRDLAWQPETAVSLIDGLEPLVGNGKITAEFISSHETISDGEIEYNNLYLIQPLNAFLHTWGTLGEFVDDNYDFCLHASISFHDTPEAALTDVLAKQKRLALDAFDTGFQMALSALSGVDESIRAETMKQMRRRAGELARHWRANEQRKSAVAIAA
jgi:hypothetical protein